LLSLKVKNNKKHKTLQFEQMDVPQEERRIKPIKQKQQLKTKSESLKESYAQLYTRCVVKIFGCLDKEVKQEEQLQKT
jgi:hypothetical protein